MTYLRARSLFVWAAISWLAMFSQSGSSQTPKSSGSGQSSGDYVFRSTVRRVPVDVVVQDKNGNPVTGLKKEDFLIEEDGKKQSILSFDVFNGVAPAYVPPKLPPMPPNTFVDLPAQAERGPLYVLYYDMVNTRCGFVKNC